MCDSLRERAAREAADLNAPEFGIALPPSQGFAIEEGPGFSWNWWAFRRSQLEGEKHQDGGARQSVVDPQLLSKTNSASHSI